MMLGFLLPRGSPRMQRSEPALRRTDGGYLDLDARAIQCRTLDRSGTPPWDSARSRGSPPHRNELLEKEEKVDPTPLPAYAIVSPVTFQPALPNVAAFREATPTRPAG